MHYWENPSKLPYTCCLFDPRKIGSHFMTTGLSEKASQKTSMSPETGTMWKGNESSEPTINSHFQPPSVLTPQISTIEYSTEHLCCKKNHLNGSCVAWSSLSFRDLWCFCLWLMVVSNQLVSWTTYRGVKYILRIHVWYIYLHLVDFYGKYRYTYTRPMDPMG